MVVNVFVIIKLLKHERIRKNKTYIYCTNAIYFGDFNWSFNFKRPKNTYAINTQETLHKITNTNVLVTLNSLENPNYIPVDVRSPFEFEKGHLENAINIHTPDILNEKNIAFFNELKATNKTAILYGNTPQDANVPFVFYIN
ncbi:hypothetical protein JCM19301_3609 [Jejuia pallidilutea]|uniref:Rhodanese domain-containing protein n=1 Tax=Jejuia pallidilutea TaxID=504487 RepID=A0A090VRK1_9FLAO|nr:rhodanese-like domain-containing protein [Jejuia pallidilutea]GAL65924.1 hypothetical protein JCM19301_3609 [Jejuia pallidilutea]